MPNTLKILLTTDLHGYVMPYDYATGELRNQGLVRVSPWIKQLRDENTLLVDNGDCLQGSPLILHAMKYTPKEITPVAKALNYLKYDYVNVGNHDFNYGFDNLLRYMDTLDAPCICGNIYHKGEQVFKPYQIKVLPNGKKIAIFGIVTHYIPNWEQAVNIVDVTFAETLEYTKNLVKEIRENEKPDCIIGVYHGGLERDMKTGVPTEEITGENQGYEICKQVEGLDILLLGHQHRSQVGKCFNTYILQPLQNARELGYMEYDLDSKEVITAQLLTSHDEIDQDLVEIVREDEEKAQKWLDQVIGTFMDYDDLLLPKDLFQARLHKHPCVSFLNAAVTTMINAQIGSNFIANECSGFQKKLTMRHLVGTYPYPNTLVKVEINGKDLKAYLEQCANYFVVENGEVVVNPTYVTPKPEHYNYDMLDGIDYTIKVSNPVGERIIELSYQGRPIKEEDTFTLVLNNYRAAGGGNFSMLRNCKVLEDQQKDVVDCLMEYIISNPEIHFEHKDNITVIV